MALFGWTTPRQAAVYMKKVNRARFEASAAPLLEADAATKMSHHFRYVFKWNDWRKKA